MRDGGDVAVVGAGLIGLAIAFELAQRGAVVRVYDRAEPGRGASWAGAGMLAPYTEHADDEAMLSLCETSLASYPRFVERTCEASGIDAHLCLNGILHAAFDPVQLERLRVRADALRARGVDCRMLDRDETACAEPALSAAVLGSLLIEGEGHVDNRRFGRALAQACRASGVVLSHATSLRVECDARRVLGVRSDLGFAPAAAVVNACGAWASQLEGPPPDALPPVEPVKGQMLALEMPRDFVRRATWVPDAYLVPRDDGRLLIGATAEREGFDVRVTAEGMHRLLHAALAAAPALAGFTVSEQWAGLRPASPDGRPFLGRTPLKALFVASGHYRNGILLAPVTARLLADAVEGREPAELADFALARVARKAAAGGE
jgi:glycine oxidase